MSPTPCVPEFSECSNFKEDVLVVNVIMIYPRFVQTILHVTRDSNGYLIRGVYKTIVSNCNLPWPQPCFPNQTFLNPAIMILLISAYVWMRLHPFVCPNTRNLVVQLSPFVKRLTVSSVSMTNLLPIHTTHQRKRRSLSNGSRASETIHQRPVRVPVPVVCQPSACSNCFGARFCVSGMIPVAVKSVSTEYFKYGSTLCR